MATSVMNEIMAIPAQQIPQSLLANAQGIAIIPSVVKVSLIGGIRHGKGVVVVRDEGGLWAAPQFVTLTGGSVGWQVGIQSTDVILVFKTRKSVVGLTRGKFTIGVDAAAAAGPVGRQAAAATDAQLRAEILSYSRSRGLFAGVSIDGSALQIDGMANTAYYYPAGYTPYAAATGQGAVVPASAMQLVSTVSRYTTTQVPAPEIAAVTPLTAENPIGAAAPLAADPAPESDPADYLRQQLINSAANLNVLLDENWKQFLALPGEIFANTGSPAAEQMDAVLANYDQVARNCAVPRPGQPARVSGDIRVAAEIRGQPVAAGARYAGLATSARGVRAEYAGAVLNGPHIRRNVPVAMLYVLERAGDERLRRS